MKKLLFALSIAFASLSYAQTQGPPAGDALPEDTYGAGVRKKAKPISTKTLQRKLKTSSKAENIAVRGKVTEVCPKKGCWITLETENNEKLSVKMKDYAFFVPTALEGKTVVMEGNAEVKTLSVEEARHYAEDAKKSQAEINAITQPQKEIRFLASGIKVVD